MPFQSDYGGEWTITIYRNCIDGSETPVLQKGQISRQRPTLVWVHGTSIFADLRGQPGSRKHLLQRAMVEIGKDCAGVIVVFTASGGSSLCQAIGTEPEAVQMLSYGIGARVLADLGISDMILLTNTHHTMVGLQGYGLSVLEERRIPQS